MEMQKKTESSTKEYLERRSKNNISVRKSRAKLREKITQTQARVKNLAKENKTLEQEVSKLDKELGILKCIFTKFFLEDAKLLNSK